MTALATFVVLLSQQDRWRSHGDSGDGLAMDEHAIGIDEPQNARDVAPYQSPEDTVLTALPEGVVERNLLIGRRESFYDAARRLGASHRDIMALVPACKPYKNLERVRAGDLFRTAIDTTGALLRLRFDLDDNESYIVFERDAAGAYTAYPLTYPVQRRTCVAAGTVEGSLFLSLQACGAPTVLASKINDILGWDVDFRRDVRSGDTFRILYEEVRRDGQYVRSGPVMALEYVNRGHSYKGYRFSDTGDLPGYYDETGRNLEKQLIRAPLEYSRISSPFTLRRYHPIEKKWRPHYGVDYAAPIGTPVHAAGSGTVLDAYYKGGNGRFVHIQHTNRSYETYYLHLSRFAKGIRKGVKVRQGQVIGYVGMSGEATGPHLDYRVKVDGRWRNPRRLKLPASEPVSTDAIVGFLACVSRYDASLFSTPQNSGLVVVRLPSPAAATSATGATVTGSAHATAAPISAAPSSSP